jgi:hypothetical protein
VCLPHQLGNLLKEAVSLRSGSDVIGALGVFVCVYITLATFWYRKSSYSARVRVDDFAHKVCARPRLGCCQTTTRTQLDHN